MQKVRSVLRIAAILTVIIFLIGLIVNGLSVATSIGRMTSPTCNHQYDDPANTVRSRTFDDRSISCLFACQINGATQAHAVRQHSIVRI
jgi:TRAP-type C4-dicarboxylate transport system permease small subunit